jgi:hypothetical protein
MTKIFSNQMAAPNHNNNKNNHHSKSQLVKPSPFINFISFTSDSPPTNHSPFPSNQEHRIMEALSADAKIMADLLAALTHPDTNAIRQAEVALKPLLKRPECVPVLVEVIKARKELVRSYLCRLLSSCIIVYELLGCCAYDVFKNTRCVSKVQCCPCSTHRTKPSAM